MTGNLRSIFDGRLWTLDEWMHEPIDRTKTGYFERGGLYVFNNLTAARYPFQNAHWWPHMSWGRDSRRSCYDQWRAGYSPVVVRCIAKGKDTKKTASWLGQQKSRYSSVKPIAIIRGSN